MRARSRLSYRIRLILGERIADTRKVNPRTHSRRIRILSLILLCPALVSIPFFPSEWKDSLFFSPVRILSLSPKLKAEAVSKILFRRFEDPYHELGLRFEYVSRKFKEPASEKNIAPLAKLLASSFGLELIRIYDYNYSSVYSSDKEGPAFHSDLKLSGLECPKMGWVTDSQGFLIFRNAEGNLYFQIRKEDGDRLVSEFNLTRSSYLPKESDEGVLYWIFRKEEEGYELLETNLNPTSPILPGSVSSLAHFSEAEEGSMTVHTLLLKASQNSGGFQRPVWQRIKKGNTEIFLTLPRDSRAKQLLILLGALAVSFLSLLFGILASRLLYIIRMESRFLEREDSLRMKLDLAGLLNRFREFSK